MVIIMGSLDVFKNRIKQSGKKRNKNYMLLCLLFGCGSLYVILQLEAVYKLLPVKHNRMNLLSAITREPRKQPYISFLASVVIPLAAYIDKDCMRHLQSNRTFMSTLEILLSNKLRYEELVYYLKKEIVYCIEPFNQLDLTAKNSPFAKRVANGVIRSNFVGGMKFITPVKVAKTPTTKSKITSPAAPYSWWESLRFYEGSPCLVDSSKLNDLVPINLNVPPPQMCEIEKEYPYFQLGGFYPGPKFCRPRHATAIIIPYRDRDIHLRYWLHYTLGTLIMQQILFTVFVVEQEGTGVFNKGQLMNTAFLWASTYAKVNFDCYVFHDVDMIPEVPGNFYECANGKFVRHLSPFIDKYNYTGNTKIGITVGGAVAFTDWQYRAVNGYSNAYWGWGGEDDDMNLRIKQSGFTRIRPIWELSRYKMIPHTNDRGNPVNTIRFNLLKTAKRRMATDGLTNLKTVIKKVSFLPTYTHILVGLLTQPPANSTASHIHTIGISLSHALAKMLA